MELHMAIARGYAATDATKPLAPFTFERREPNDDDVVIDIKFAGICHSDIHTVRNEWQNAVYPIVPGHEIAGIVTAVGSKVTKFKVRSEEHTSELQSLMRIAYAVFCSKKKNSRDQHDMLT